MLSYPQNVVAPKGCVVSETFGYMVVDLLQMHGKTCMLVYLSQLDSFVGFRVEWFSTTPLGTFRSWSMGMILPFVLSKRT